MYISDSDTTKFKVFVKTELYENSDNLKKLVLDKAKDGLYDYVTVCGPRYKTGVDINFISKVSENISGLSISSLDFNENYTEQEAKEFILDKYQFRYCYGSKLRCYKWDLFPYGNSRIYDLSIPFFLNDFLSSRHLILVPKIYADIKDEFSFIVLDLIKRKVRSGLRHIVAKDFANAKEAAKAREILDNQNIDWHSFKDDAKKGIYHDDILENVLAQAKNELGKKELIDGPKKDVKVFSFDELCEIYEKKYMSWKLCYNGVVQDDDTDGFYVNDEEKIIMSLDDLNVNEKNAWSKYCLPEYEYATAPFIISSIMWKDKNNPTLTIDQASDFISYLKFIEGVDVSEMIEIIEKSIESKLDIRNKWRNIEKAPPRIYIQDFDTSKYKKFNETPRYKWKIKNKEIVKEAEKLNFLI